MTIYTYYFGLNNFLSYYFCFCTIQMLKNWKKYTKTYQNHTYLPMSMVLAKRYEYWFFKNWKLWETYLSAYFLTYFFFLSHFLAHFQMNGHFGIFFTKSCANLEKLPHTKTILTPYSYSHHTFLQTGLCAELHRWVFFYLFKFFS